MNYHHLTLEERNLIAQMKGQGKSICAIASELRRSPSTIYRELGRNKLEDKQHYAYGPSVAQQKYESRIHQETVGKFGNEALIAYVSERLMMSWTPERIAEQLALDFPEDREMQISYATIYRWVKKGKVARPPSGECAGTAESADAEIDGENG